MKSLLFTLALGWIAALVLSGCAAVHSAPKEAKVMEDHPGNAWPPRKVIRLSCRTYDDNFNADREIKAFYLHLLESNSKVRRQFESLSTAVRDEYGPHFMKADPQVVEWFPSEESWNAPEEFQSNTNYLVIQPIGYGRSRHAGHETVIVSEFNVTDCGKVIAPESLKDGRMATTTTMTFLGFRHLQIGVIEPTT